MSNKTLSLKWLEVFQLVAKTGSIQKTADKAGLSISTVSNHLRSLENALGVELVDHNRRPMGLTSAGVVYARHVYEGLMSLKRGEAEIRSGRWQHATDLRLGLIDDFDNQIAPELFRHLATSMPKCMFRHFARPSHEIIHELQSQNLDAGVATRPAGNTKGLLEYPLLRDPFVLVLPENFSGSITDLIAGKSDLPFLRYSMDHTIGKLIEIQLTRNKIDLQNRFELECNQSIIGLVASGNSWTITTAASYYRAHRFHQDTKVMPFPGKNFARTVSLFTTNIYPVTTSRHIRQTLLELIRQHFTEPMTELVPWLADDLRILAGDDG